MFSFRSHRSVVDSNYSEDLGKAPACCLSHFHQGKVIVLCNALQLKLKAMHVGNIRGKVLDSYQPPTKLNRLFPNQIVYFIYTKLNNNWRFITKDSLWDLKFGWFYREERPFFIFELFLAFNSIFHMASVA